MSGMKSTLKPSEIVVGIDLGTTKVCVVVGQVKNNSVEIVGVGKQHSHGIRKGVVVNIPSTVDAITKSIEIAELMAGCRIESAYIGVAGSHIEGFNSGGVVAVKDKEVSEQDVERAIDAAKAVSTPVDREIIHVIPQEFVVNEQEGVRDPLGMSAVRLESKVHIVTAAASSTQNAIKCANKAGIHVNDIVLEPLASAHAVLSEDEKELGVGVVDIGGGTTDIALFAKGSIVYTASIAMGGNHITNDIAVGLRTSIQEAEQIKVKSGSAMSSTLVGDEILHVESVGGRQPKEISQSVLAKIIEPRVEEIFSLVNKEISDSGYKHLLSAGIVLTGGASLLQGLPEMGEFILETPVRRGVPQEVGGLTDVVQSPMYATAVGLLKYGLANRSRTGASPRIRANYDKIFDRVKNWLGEVF